MESPPSSSSSIGPSVVADYPSWVMLHQRETVQDDSTRDASTSASCVDSMGNTVQVSFRLVAPPAVSTLHVEISGTYSHTYPAHDWFQVLISAHRDSVLLELSCCPAFALPDNFVYIAHAGGRARLLLLPPHDEDMYVGSHITGILRRGGDEFVVASLVIDWRTLEASMCLLRSGERKWEHRNGIPVLHADGHEAELSRWNPWNNGSVIAVGDQFLCWINPVRGIIISDVTNKIPELRYVPLPADPFLSVRPHDGNVCGPDRRHDPRASRNVCVTVAGAVRFVRISPRCYCGWFRTSSCARSQRDFVITTWTLRTDDMTWKEDCVLDNNGDPWAVALEAAGVPLVPPAFPFMSIEAPDVVCFVSSESIHQRRSLHDYAGDKSAWLISVDTRRKTLRSVCRYPEDDDSLLLHLGRPTFLPSEVSSYFNTPCHCGNDNPVPSSQEGEEKTDVLAAIREIPDMDREEMARAHSLVAGNDRRVGFLGALPMGMRKEYCMILTELERNLRLPNDVITQQVRTN